MPGILVLLVTMLTLFLSAMNIVREEIGTLEQINVTPIKKTPVHHRKLFPFWVLGLMLLSVGLLIARLVFRIILGNIGLIYLFTTVYLLVILGIGLFISNYTDTQQQAMFIAWFFSDFYSNEWIVYSYRKHAELGSTSDFVQSHPLFCGNNSDGNA
jgi:ABC-2 type transport system permease protein